MSRCPSFNRTSFIAFLFCLNSYLLFAQCQFSITHTATSDHCIYATEDVVWNKSTKVNVTVSGNTVTKSAGSNGAWDAGAISVNKVKKNGWASTVIAETGKTRIFGLSATGPHINATTAVQYGFMIRGDNGLDIIEGTSYTFTSSTVSAGTVLRIWNDNGVVKFYVNGSLIRTSAVVPPAILYVDAVLQSTGSTISNVTVTNGTDGSFAASALASDLGTAVQYEWFKNGVSTGPAAAGNTTYTDVALVTNDVITCRLTQTGGCGATINSNQAVIRIESPTLFGSYYTLNNEASFACLEAVEQITAYQNISNVGITGNSLTKNTGTDGSFNAGAQSVAQVVNNGFAQATITEQTTLRTFGLASLGNDNAYTSVKYGYYVRGDGKMQVIDQGVLKGIDNDSYASGEILKIYIENNVVKYYRGVTGTTLAYISSITPVYPLYADIAFNSINGTVNNIRIGNGSTGAFTTTASPVTAGAVYDWTLNGAPAPGATNAPTYSNTALTGGDAIVCTIKPGQVGCILTTPAITMSTRNYGGDFYISNAASVIACAETAENVKFTNLVGVTASGNTVTKFQGGDGQWNAGATSLNQIINNGYAEFDIRQTDRTQMFGITSLASNPANANDASIQFGFAFYGNATFRIIESGTGRTGYMGYAPNQTFRVKIDNNTVRYYQIISGVASLIYTSLVSSAVVSAAMPYVVDVSLNTQNTVFAEIFNARVSNGSTGVFVTNAPGAGAAPQFQWQLNGTDISGATSSTYASSLLVLNDQVTCSMIPDIAGCQTPQISNSIRVNIVGGPSSPVATWTGNTSTAWDDAGNWDIGIPSGYTKVNIPNGRARYPTIGNTAGAYDITIGTAASLTVAGTNALTVFNTWDNQGVWNANSSTVNLRTCTNNKNTIKSPAAGETFYDLNINNKNHVDAYSNHSVSHTLTLTSGIVTMMNTTDRMIIQAGATVTGASNLSHVDGKVTKAGNTLSDYPFDFPVGDAGVYRKITISRPSLATDQFTAQYYKTSAQTRGTLMNAAFWTVSGCEHWELQRTAGVSDVQVTLSWVASECSDPATYVTTPALAALRVAYLNDTDPLPANYIWEDKGNTATTGTGAAGTVSSNATVGAYGFFTLATVASGNTLPVELVDFNAAAAATNVMLTWKTLSELNSDYFEVQRSTDESFAVIGSVTGAGTSKSKNNYHFIDHKPQVGNNYYRLRQVDADGRFTYSNVVRVIFDGELSLSFYPNPVRRGDALYLVSSADEVMFTDVLGKQYVKRLNKERAIATDDLTPGVYFLSDGYTGFQRVVIY